MKLNFLYYCSHVWFVHMFEWFIYFLYIVSQLFPRSLEYRQSSDPSSQFSKLKLCNSAQYKALRLQNKCCAFTLKKHCTNRKWFCKCFRHDRDLQSVCVCVILIWWNTNIKIFKKIHGSDFDPQFDPVVDHRARRRRHVPLGCRLSRSPINSNYIFEIFPNILLTMNVYRSRS